MEFLTLFSVIALMILAFIPSENDEHVIKFMTLLILLGFFSVSIYSISYDNGVKDGACNLLKGKYEVNYVIDNDSCVVDTIININ